MAPVGPGEGTRRLGEAWQSIGEVFTLVSPAQTITESS